MAEGLLSFNIDLISIILSFLPTEDLLRVKTVCHLWARVISDPVFARNHCSRPAPITASFTQRYLIPMDGMQYLNSLNGAKFPSCISRILLNGFEAVSRSHGVICFRRDMIFVVGNPATSYWSVVRFPPTCNSYMHGRVVLIYDPAISFNFKLALARIKCDQRVKVKYYIQFSIYSSETGSWTVSSVFTQFQNLVDRRLLRNIQYEPCKSGGGSVCWRDMFGFLVGYDTSTDSLWKIQLPPFADKAGSKYMTSYDGIIYYTRFGYGNAEVWRLEGKESWIWEGYGSSKELQQFDAAPVAYDRARRTLLLIGGRIYGKYFALHFPSSRLEVLSQSSALPGESFDTDQVAHCNTLAPLHGAQRGMDGLVREFFRLGLDPLKL